MSFLVVRQSTVDLTGFEEIALKGLATIQQHKTQLKIALENKKSLALDVRIKAPVLLLPETCAASDTSPLVIVDLGHLNISNAVDLTERR
jgi:Repeating coiled region of VPS13